MSENSDDREDMNDDYNAENVDDDVDSLELWSDKMAISEDVPMTYGEYREAREDADHPFRDPENPRHEEYLRAEEQMEELRQKYAVPFASNVTASLPSFYLSKFTEGWKTPKLLDAFGAIKDVAGAGNKDLVEQLGIPGSKFRTDYASTIQDQINTSREAWERQMEDIRAATAKKQEEERLFRERLVFSMNRLAELQIESAASSEQRRKEDLVAQSERDEKEKIRFRIMLVVGIFTLAFTIVGIVVPA